MTEKDICPSEQWAQAAEDFEASLEPGELYAEDPYIYECTIEGCRCLISRPGKCRDHRQQEKAYD